MSQTTAMEPPARTRDGIVSASETGMVFPGPVVALEDASFHVKRGEFVSLIGPSGCGKSTLLRLVSGLIKPTAGRLNVFGTPVDGPRAEIGMMFQKPTLLDWKSVFDNVLLPITLAGTVTKADQARRIRASFRGACSNVLPLRGSLLRVRNCCCWMSRSGRWMNSPAND